MMIMAKLSWLCTAFCTLHFPLFGFQRTAAPILSSSSNQLLLSLEPQRFMFSIPFWNCHLSSGTPHTVWNLRRQGDHWWVKPCQRLHMLWGNGWQSPNPTVSEGDQKRPEPPWSRWSACCSWKTCAPESLLFHKHRVYSHPLPIQRLRFSESAGGQVWGHIWGDLCISDLFFGTSESPRIRESMEIAAAIQDAGKGSTKFKSLQNGQWHQTLHFQVFTLENVLSETQEGLGIDGERDPATSCWRKKVKRHLCPLICYFNDVFNEKRGFYVAARLSIFWMWSF